MTKEMNCWALTHITFDRPLWPRFSGSSKSHCNHEPLSVFAQRPARLIVLAQASHRLAAAGPGVANPPGALATEPRSHHAFTSTTAALGYGDNPHASGNGSILATSISPSGRDSQICHGARFHVVKSEGCLAPLSCSLRGQTSREQALKLQCWDFVTVTQPLINPSDFWSSRQGLGPAASSLCGFLPSHSNTDLANKVAFQFSPPPSFSSSLSNLKSTSSGMETPFVVFQNQFVCFKAEAPAKRSVNRDRDTASG